MIRRTPDISHRLAVRLAAFTAACVTLIVHLSPAYAPAQEPAPTITAQRSEIRGSLVIVGGGLIPDAIVDRFLELGGGLKTRLVVITTASTLADSPEIESRVAFWHEQPVAAVHVMHTRDRDVANSHEFSQALEDATAVWFGGGNQNYVTSVYRGTKTEERLHALVRRGGVIGGTSAGAAIMSHVMIGGNTPDGPMITTGLGFLPGTIVDQHFLKRNRQHRLSKALKIQPGMVGIGIDEATALVVSPTKAEVIGDSDVVLCLAETQQRKEITQRFKPGDVIQLDKWSLGAAGRARLHSYATAEKRPSPDVPQGAVVISGRKTPKAAVEEFLAAAGGKAAPVVLVSEHADDEDDQAALQSFLTEIGAENVRLCRASTVTELDRPEFQQTLAEARGVWFVGAQERRMLDMVVLARMDRLVKDVLSRGGVVGGSSAGAKIHGDGVLFPANDDDDDPLDELYACGLGVLSGMIIEHQPMGDESATSMAKALQQRFPKCMGLGLQDSAAVIVRGHMLQVVGPESVTIIGEAVDDQSVPTAVEMVHAGEKYNLRERRRMELAEGDAATR